MADVFLDNQHIHVLLTPMERLGALHGDLEFGIDQVRSVSVSEDPFAPVRGVRSPGTGCPGVIALGTWRSREHGRSFVAAYRNRPALVLELDDDRFARIVISTGDARRIAAALAG